MGNYPTLSHIKSSYKFKNKNKYFNCVENYNNIKDDIMYINDQNSKTTIILNNDSEFKIKSLDLILKESSFICFNFKLTDELD